MSATTSPTALGPVSAYVRQRLSELLDTRRVVVWFDAERAFIDLAPRLDLPRCRFISREASSLRARREAEAVYRRMNEADGSPEARQNLLIYVPSARGSTADEQQQDPFEGFAHCGATFGDQEGEHLASLARLALPEREAEIERLFREGRPTLALLDVLPSGAHYPLVQQALGAESPLEAITMALSSSDTTQRLERVPGALGELKRLLVGELGLGQQLGDTWIYVRDRLATYLLTSEFASELGDALPSALVGVPYAGQAQLPRVRDVLGRLRATEAGQEAYVQLANMVEHDLRLPSLLTASTIPVQRETFACQERAHLQMLAQAAVTGDLDTARDILSMDDRSVWRRDPERALHWQVAQRCVTFLGLAREAETRALPTGMRTLIEAYTSVDGLWRVDRAQRHYEHAAALCAQDDPIESLVQACRVQYQHMSERLQSAFQQAIDREGWPPEGIRRQTQTFDSRVAPELDQAHKVAYFLVDSLRYEMGRDLTEALQDMGSVTLNGVVTVVPTTTPCGMAALMPGADGAFTFVEQRGELVPAIGGTPLPTNVERMGLLTAKYGDRYFDVTLEEMLSTSQKTLEKRIGRADLVVVRTQDIDALGEGPSLYRARKAMSEVIGELKTAANRLAKVGFDVLIFAADHGHVLIPEVLAGDVLPEPPGEWVLKTRRSMLGEARATAPGLVYLRAQQMDIIGPVVDFVAATGFKTFRGGAGYFHEGLSLQECIVPMLVVYLGAQSQVPDADVQVKVIYRSDRFTSSLVSVKVSLLALFTPSLSIRLEAFAGADAKALSIGQAGDCDVRDPATGEIMLRAGEEVQVPLVIDPDFQGKHIEIRAIDARTGAVLDRLRLKNARME